MQYIPTQQQPQQGAAKYHGDIATGYDAKREQSPKWTIEQGHIESMLDDLQWGDWVLDCPAGTGRFIPYCQKRGLMYVGCDLSLDMLKQAAQKITTEPKKVWLVQADVRQLPREDKSIDASIMCRLTRWLSPDDCVLALKELQRISRKKIISTWRVANHPHARGYDLIKSALNGWQIARDEEGADPDYRIIELRPC